MIQREHAAQRTDNAFLRHALPVDAYYTAIDHANIGGKTKEARIRAGKLRKDRGVKAGIPDWLIVWRGITLWIERKAGTGLSDEQIITRKMLVDNGHRWALAKTLDDVEAACLDAGIPLRATAGAIQDRVDTAAARPKRKSAPRPAGPRNVAPKSWRARAGGKGVRV